MMKPLLAREWMRPPKMGVTAAFGQIGSERSHSGERPVAKFASNIL